MLDTVRISFSGLNTDSCWKPDRAEAVFGWTPGSNDIGVHRLRVFTQTILGEPDPLDNEATLVYMVKPGDYATEELNDPWDMTEESGAPPPAWYTEDIESMYGWDSSAYTDSISGMLEGVIDDTYSLTNKMTLELDGNSIDGSDYSSISLIGKSGLACDVYLTWRTNIPGIDSVMIDEMSSYWEVLEPFDLSTISSWDGKTITDVSLSFRRPRTTDYHVRIGWIKLTE